MKLLVTGAAGFLGSHLCETLLRMDHEVIGIDNYYTGSKSNLLGLIDNPKFELIRHDVTFPIYLEIDGIFNLACPASPIHYQKNPVQTFKTNVHGAINILGLAKRTGAKVLQASTSEIYGDPEQSPQVETYWGNVNPIGIRSCYDEGKRAAETLFFDYHRQYDVDIRVARIFNTYGPRMAFNDGRVISNFIVQSLKNEPLTVYGDGKQTRSFCYVTDLIEGLVKLFFKDNVHEPINLGNPAPTSMVDVAKEIIAMTNSKSELNFLPLPLDDPKKREPNIERAKGLLDWYPKIDRSEGIRKTIIDFETRLNVIKNGL